MNRIIIVFIVFLILLSGILLIGGTIPYYLFYVFLLTLLLPLLHNLLILRGISGFVEVPRKSLFSGENLQIDYKITNGSIFNIPYLEVQSTITKELTGIIPPVQYISLNKKNSYYNSENLKLNRRGYYQLGEIRLCIKDVFGLYKFTKNVSSSASLLVYPEIKKISTLRITASQQSGELLDLSSNFEDRTRINSLKEYSEGDSIKSIHWKLTAKKDIPILKEYEHRGDSEVYIFLDNDIINYSNDFDRHIEDKACDTSLSIIDYCLENNIKVDLNIFSEEDILGIKGQQRSDIKPFLEELAKFKGNINRRFHSLLSLNIDNLHQGSSVFIITPCLDKPLGGLVIDLKGKNIHPQIICITDKEYENIPIDKGVSKSIINEGIPLYIIDYSSSLKESLEV